MQGNCVASLGDVWQSLQIFQEKILVERSPADVAGREAREAARNEEGGCEPLQRLAAVFAVGGHGASNCTKRAPQQ